MEFPNFVKWAFGNIPGVQWALRNIIFWSNELNFSSFQANTLMSKIGKYCHSFSQMA